MRRSPSFLTTVGHPRGVRALGVVAMLCLVLPLTSSAATQRTTGTFQGYAFDACTAPATASLQAWDASPYRGLGIYIGGVNRACSQSRLTPAWVTTTLGLGWSLLPLYVGLQAPCVSQSGLAKLSATPATASSQGRAAADDAAADANALGLPAGSPVYLDMEGYKLGDAACTRAVQSFVTGWVTELRAAGFLAGVYGSAASTVRDVSQLGPALPDAIWIANWNNVESVFGDPYVPDSLWANHQRVHQYKGGHDETWGGVKINIDSNVVDGPVVGGGAPPPPPPPPPAGSVGSGDGRATASWPAGAFTTPVTVTLTPTPQPPAPNGYAVQLTVMDTSSTPSTPVTTFAAPVTVHVAAPAPGLAPQWSTDGATWTPLPLLTSSTLPTGVLAGYTVERDGSFDVLTLVPGYVGLLPDTVPPSQPQGFAGRFVNGSLRLSWLPSTDNSGAVVTYQVLLDGNPFSTVTGSTPRAIVRAFHPGGQTVYRVEAVDAAGNASKPSRPLVVVPTTRPALVPRIVPAWSWQLYDWQHGGGGTRPARAPRRPPAWYWAWAAWRAAPFHLR